MICLRLLTVLGLCFVLSGCLTLKDIGVAGASAGTAAVVSAVGATPAVVLTTSAGAGLAAAAAIPDEPVSPEDYGGEDMQINTFWELMTYAVAKFFNHVVTIGIIGGVIWLGTGYIGARMRRPEEKALEAQLKMLVDKVGKMKE